MTNLEHDLIVALRQCANALDVNAHGLERVKAWSHANRLLKRHDPEYTCPICDGGPGNNCPCSCPQP